MTLLVLFGGIVVFAAVDAESQAEQITSAVQRSSIVAMSDDSAAITDLHEVLQNSDGRLSLERDSNVAKMRVALLSDCAISKGIARSWGAGGSVDQQPALGTIRLGHEGYYTGARAH